MGVGEVVRFHPQAEGELGEFRYRQLPPQKLQMHHDRLSPSID